MDESGCEQDLSARKVRSIRSLVPSLLDWYLKNARPLPWRNTTDPYAIWVSEIMLQQTQVKTVIPFWKRWMLEMPTVQDLAEANTDRVLKLWEGLGYYRRVRHMQIAARQVVEKHHGRFPSDFESILALPGIGRYTAGAICSIASDQAVPILDGNVERVLTRLYGIRSNPKERKTAKRLWKLAGEWVSAAQPFGKGSCSALNQGLMELGATICTPSGPRCDLCPLRDGCSAFRQNTVRRIPAIPRRSEVTRENRIAVVIEDKSGHVMVRQRPVGLVNAGLWEFPNELLAPDDSIETVLQKSFGIRSMNVKWLMNIEHSITRYRITVKVFRLRIASLKKLLSTKRDFVRHPTARLHELAFPSAHRRIVRRIQNPITGSRALS